MDCVEGRVVFLWMMVKDGFHMASSQAVQAKFGPQSYRWVFPREAFQTSANRADKLSVEHERYLRRASRKTTAYALLLFHWFYVLQSFKRHDRNFVAMAAIFLASKLDEAPRKMKDVIGHYEVVQARRKLPPDSELFASYQTKLCTKEKILLQTIEFQVCIELPFAHISSSCSALGKSMQVPRSASSALAQAAAGFAFDAFRTDICVRYRPQYIAVACMYLASKFLNVPLPESWFSSQFPHNPSHTAVLEEIVHHILCIYEGENTGSSRCRCVTLPKPPHASPLPDAASTPLAPATPGPSNDSLYGDDFPPLSASQSAPTPASARVDDDVPPISSHDETAGDVETPAKRSRTEP